MNLISCIRRLAGVLAGLVVALVAFGSAAPAAFAEIVPPPGDYGGGSPQIYTVVTGGMPGWQITLITIGAALLASVVAVSLDRARAARHRVTAEAA